jgi:dihydrodipicolinate synthase/N-acetylneuraminate lyase
LDIEKFWQARERFEKILHLLLFLLLLGILFSCYKVLRVYLGKNEPTKPPPGTKVDEKTTQQKQQKVLKDYFLLSCVIFVWFYQLH